MAPDPHHDRRRLATLETTVKHLSRRLADAERRHEELRAAVARILARSEGDEV
jgi:hypothetical protein